MNTDKNQIKNPSWWNDQHASAWDRVKEALLRDWEQTKADLSGQKLGHDLNQDVGDTLKQAAGKQEIPVALKQNVPEQPKDAIKRVEALDKTIDKADDRIADAKKDMADVEKNRAEETRDARASLQRVKEEVQQDLEKARRKSELEIAEARAELANSPEKVREKIAHAEQRVRDEQEKANQKLADAQAKFAGKLVDASDDAIDGVEKDEKKIDEANRLRLRAERDRAEVEHAMRYGYSVRSRYPNTNWDTKIEDELRADWSSFNARTWDESKGDIRRGWDRASKPL
jgi:hypothetical protein